VARRSQRPSCAGPFPAAWLLAPRSRSRQRAAQQDRKREQRSRMPALHAAPCCRCRSRGLPVNHEAQTSACVAIRYGARPPPRRADQLQQLLASRGHPDTAPCRLVGGRSARGDRRIVETFRSRTAPPFPGKYCSQARGAAQRARHDASFRSSSRLLWGKRCAASGRLGRGAAAGNEKAGTQRQRQGHLGASRQVASGKAGTQPEAGARCLRRRARNRPALGLQRRDQTHVPCGSPPGSRLVGEQVGLQSVEGAGPGRALRRRQGSLCRNAKTGCAGAGPPGGLGLRPRSRKRWPQKPVASKSSGRVGGVKAVAILAEGKPGSGRVGAAPADRFGPPAPPVPRLRPKPPVSQDWAVRSTRACEQGGA